MTTASLEATEALSAAGATAPRVSISSMEAKIKQTWYIRPGDALAAQGHAYDPQLDIMTLAFVVMENGFVVVGKSAPASPANFDPEKGRTFAYEDAIRQLWPLEGYALRERLSGPVPDDVTDLVIAARNVAFGDQPPEPDAIRQLDKASEAFASRIPWDDEPTAEEIAAPSSIGR